MKIQSVLTRRMPLTRRMRLMQKWIARRWDIQVRGRVCHWLYEYITQYHVPKHESVSCMIKIKLIERGFFEGLRKEPMPSFEENLAIIRKRDEDCEIRLQEYLSQTGVNVARSKIFQTTLKVRPIDQVALKVAMPDNR